MDVCICFLKQIAKVHFFFELASNNMSCRFLLLSVAGLFIHAAGCEAGRITISLTYRLFGKNNELNAYKLFFLCIFASPKTATALSPVAFGSREESPGSTESPYFLTGRGVCRKTCATASATENIPLPCGGLPLRAVRVKTRGKSSRRGVAIPHGGKPYGLKNQIYRQ